MWDFESESDPGDWGVVDAPVDATLFDVTETAAGPCAVGEKGLVLGRGEEGWGVVVSDGPKGRSRTLRAVAATACGKRAWFAGGDGALGYYDLDTGEARDYTGPRGNENGMVALAVSGERGQEKVLVADDSANTVPGFMRPDGMTWRPSQKPESAAALEALDAGPGGDAFGVDGEGNAWETGDDGYSRIGIDEADVGLFDVEAGETIIVGGGNGWVFESESADWHPTKVGDFSVTAVSIAPAVKLAGGGDGALFFKSDGDWTEIEWGASEQIYGATAESGVAVGENGTIIEQGIDEEDEAFWVMDDDVERDDECEEETDAA